MISEDVETKRKNVKSFKPLRTSSIVLPLIYPTPIVVSTSYAVYFYLHWITMLQLSHKLNIKRLWKHTMITPRCLCISMTTRILVWEILQSRIKTTGLSVIHDPWRWNPPFLFCEYQRHHCHMLETKRAIRKLGLCANIMRLVSYPKLRSFESYNFFKSRPNYKSPCMFPTDRGTFLNTFRKQDSFPDKYKYLYERTKPFLHKPGSIPNR
jgi:hypothetical protein